MDFLGNGEFTVVNGSFKQMSGGFSQRPSELLGYKKS